MFSLDSKFTRIMGRVGDLMALNLIFLVTCIPLITTGAACTALYTVCFRLGTEREGKLVRTYFQSFKENFKQSTVLWLAVLVCGAASVVNAYLFYAMTGPIRWCFLLFTSLFALILLVTGYIFPLLSQFSSSVRSTVRNALLLSVGYLPRSLLVAVLNILPVVLLLIAPYTFLQVGVLWITLYFSTAAYGNSILLRKVFAPYMANETGEDAE